MPSSFKLRGRTKKHLLKQAVKPLLPPRSSIGQRWASGSRSTSGSGATCATSPVTFYSVLPRASAAISARPSSRRLIDEHVKGTRQWHYQLWNLTMFELWHRMFVDERPERARRASPPTPAACA
jgi:hypothetical protein